MVVFVNIKDGKVDLTKEELDQLLKDEHQRGFYEGKAASGMSYHYSCPYTYINCPYKDLAPGTPVVTFDSTKITCSMESDAKIEGDDDERRLD